MPGRGHSSPIVWGDDLLTTSIEGARRRRAQGADDLGYDLKPGYHHPDSVGADRTTREGAGLRRQERQADLGADGLRRRHVRQPPPQEHLRLVHDGHRRQVGLRVLRVGWPLRVRLDGNLLWKKSFGGIVEGGQGPGRSPIVFEDLLILQCDQEMGSGSFIVALDRRTGSEVWRQRRTTRRSWATPLSWNGGSASRW